MSAMIPRHTLLIWKSELELKLVGLPSTPEQDRFRQAINALLTLHEQLEGLNPTHYQRVVDQLTDARTFLVQAGVTVADLDATLHAATRPVGT